MAEMTERVEASRISREQAMVVDRRKDREDFEKRNRALENEHA